MKKIFFLLFSFLMLLSTTSCLSLLSAAENNYEESKSDISTYRFNQYESKYLELKIFQTLNESEALATTKKGDVVKIITKEDLYYDGNVIKGKFVLIDTYTYQTVVKAGDTDEYKQKTVPVFIKASEYVGKNKKRGAFE